MKTTVEIKSRWTDAVMHSVEIECRADCSAAKRLGLAVIEARRLGSNLSGSNLSGSNLRGSNLRGSDLRDSDLSGSDLRGSDLRDSDLRDSDLSGSDLRGSDLSGSNLRGSNLSGSDLRDSDLRGSNLSGSNLSRLVADRLSIVPERGEFVGVKRCRNNVLVWLRIPAEARRSNATGRKCRAEFAEVIEVVGADVGVSQHDQSVIYRVGKIVRCHEWCEDRWQECAGGIHFYLTEAEAREH